MRRVFRTAATCALALATLTLARPGAAQVGELEAHAEGRPLLAIELGIFGDGDFVGVNDFSAFHLSPSARFFYPLRDHVMLSADWGFTYGSFDNGDQSESDFRVGNLFFGAHYVKHTPNLRFRIGGGLTLPFANIPDVNNAQDLNDAVVAGLTYAVTVSARGEWDLWLWLPETMSLVIPFRLEKPIAPGIELGVDAAAAILIPIADNEGGTDLLLQAAGDVAFLLSQTIRLGFRLQFAWVATNDQNDHFPNYTSLLFTDDDDDGYDDFQLSFEPYIRGDLGNGFLQARLVVNLDEPGGFAFDDDGVWGLFLGGGVKF